MYASAWRTSLFANWPLSQRIQICRWVAASISSTLKLLSLNRASPPRTWNCTMASTSPAVAAVTWAPSSSKNWNSDPSSSVLPPHQASLRANVAPVAGSYFTSLNGPVPLGLPSSVVPDA